MLMYKTDRKFKQDESGFASIVIALTLILVLALLTVGFAQLARREQQTALNKELANQAYYAAESGINDAIQDINSKAICDVATLNPPDTCPVGSTKPTTASCMNVASGVTHTKSLSGSADVSYSCLLVNLEPGNLAGTAPPNTGQYMYFKTNPAPDNLTINWSSLDNQNTPKSGIPDPKNALNNFPPQASWGNSPPVMLVSITPIANPNAISRGQLISKTFNIFLYPSKNSDGLAHYSDPQGEIMPGGCDDNGQCSVTVDGLGATNSNYIIHYISYYDGANIIVQGKNDSTGAVNFIGQDEIDVTGRAHNVLKRLHVRYTTNPATGTITPAKLAPNSAIQAQNICKRLQSLPGETDFIIPGSYSTHAAAGDPCFLND